MTHEPSRSDSLVGGLIRFCLERKLVVFLITALLLGWAAIVAPFDWDGFGLPRDPVAVDAIPDLGENQQIVFTSWPGRSPQDMEDQVTYPLTVALLGVPGVRTVRSFSMLGFSTVYVIFDEGVEFYWSRSRVAEKLSSLPAGTLPEGAQPSLGPDATPLGQVFWYTLEGRDAEGNPTGGWGLDELRAVQDWTVRYALASAEGLSEVASVGGFVREYQIDADPDAMRAHGVTLRQLFTAVKKSNLDVGAGTVEINRVEYVIRGLGFLEGLEDLEGTVVRVRDNVPIRVRDVARVTLGPAPRRGALDRGGAEAVGGVAVVRYGYNPLQAIKNLRAKIEQIAGALPMKAIVDWNQVDRAGVEAFARANDFPAFVTEDAVELDHEAWLAWLHEHPSHTWPAWVTASQIEIVPFYDRSGLIRETLGTLEDALRAQLLITVLVVVLMLMHLRSSLLIGSLLPISVGVSFVLMKQFDVDANVVALSGIAIAIGTMVDMGIVVCENIVRHVKEAEPGEKPLEIVHRAASEVGGAILTAVATTVVSFLPVFFMTGAEGKLFRPLAFTKTFAIVAAAVVAITVLPAAAELLLARRRREGAWRWSARKTVQALVGGAAVLLATSGSTRLALALAALLLVVLFADALPKIVRRVATVAGNLLAVAVVLVLLTGEWLPLGPAAGDARNLLFVGGTVIGLLAIFWGAQIVYARVLAWCLAHKILFLSLPTAIVLFGASAWLGFERVFSVVPTTVERFGGDGDAIREAILWTHYAEEIPGLAKEFMPNLDEGSFLYMPSTMAHGSIGEALEVLQGQDASISQIPEVSSVVGKIGRAETPLDPAPIGMVETVIHYHSEYRLDERGRRGRYRFDRDAGEHVRDERGELIPDPDGLPFRQWRDEIRSPDDIWDEIVAAAQIPGTTSAPKLQPISTRLVMLQSGMRAPLGLKVRGPDLESIEAAGLELERHLQEIEGVNAASVFADRIVGKPYLEIELDRDALARHGVSIQDAQETIAVAIGGKGLTTTVEGRERYPVRVRYPRELRGDLDAIGRTFVSTPDGMQIPLRELADIRTVRGPQMIKSEDTFLVAYVIFDKAPGWTEVACAEKVGAELLARIESGDLRLPEGVHYTLAGSWENQVRAQRTLAVVLPVALAVIFLILYLQFRSVLLSLLVWSGVLVAWAGGFGVLWLYGQPGFLDFDVLGHSMRELFGVEATNLSVAVWVGFLALFGIATDDGVVIATYLRQSFARRRPANIAEIRAATIEAGKRRVRPCLMTTATTILALLPVLTSTGRGSDVMIPMAIPAFGGMLIALITMLVVPVLYCWSREFGVLLGGPGNDEPALSDR